MPRAGVYLTARRSIVTSAREYGPLHRELSIGRPFELPTAEGGELVVDVRERGIVVESLKN